MRAHRWRSAPPESSSPFHFLHLHQPVCNSSDLQVLSLPPAPTPGSACPPSRSAPTAPPKPARHKPPRPPSSPSTRNSDAFRYRRRRGACGDVTPHPTPSPLPLRRRTTPPPPIKRPLLPLILDYLFHGALPPIPPTTTTAATPLFGSGLTLMTARGAGPLRARVRFVRRLCPGGSRFGGGGGRCGEDV